jgi:hypothetical protein
VEIFWNERSYNICPFKYVAKISFSYPSFGNFKSQILASLDCISSGVEDILTHILPNQRLCSYFRTFSSSTKSTVLRLPSQSTIKIFFRSSDFSSSVFFHSSGSGTTCPPSHRRLSSLWIFGLWKSQMSSSCLPISFIQS